LQWNFKGGEVEASALSHQRGCSGQRRKEKSKRGKELLCLKKKKPLVLFKNSMRPRQRGGKKNQLGGTWEGWGQIAKKELSNTAREKRCCSQ